jgi:hypothetical protein
MPAKVNPKKLGAIIHAKKESKVNSAKTNSDDTVTDKKDEKKTEDSLQFKIINNPLFNINKYKYK